jgi:hypothetical protein
VQGDQGDQERRKSGNGGGCAHFWTHHKLLDEAGQRSRDDTILMHNTLAHGALAHKPLASPAPPRDISP